MNYQQESSTKAVFIEVLETVLLFNLFIYALMLFSCGFPLQTHMAIAYIATSITFMLILCVIAYHGYVIV